MERLLCVTLGWFIGIIQEMVGCSISSKIGFCLEVYSKPQASTKVSPSIGI